MRFKEAVKQTPDLKDAWQAGLGALRAEDREHIKAEDPRKLRGSVDVDTALRPKEPTANRWDFAIAYHHKNRRREFIYWVETHTGSDAEIQAVLRKLAWLKGWLQGEGNKLDRFERDFFWVSSGATSFTKGAKQVKQLSGKGLHYSGSVLRISNKHPRPTRATTG